MLRSLRLVVPFSFRFRCSFSRLFSAPPILHIERAASLIRRVVAHPAGIARNTNLSSENKKKEITKKNRKQKSATFRVPAKRDVTIHGKSFNLRAPRTDLHPGIVVESV